VAKTEASIISYYDPETPMAIEFRRLFSRLKYKQNGRPITPMLITSASHGEGKTTTASLLAVTIARQSDSRVCLVDMDLHRPRIHKLFALPLKNGITELIQGVASIDTVAKETEEEKLHVITAGTMVRSPSSLFESEQIRTTLDLLSAAYDVVVIDSPPLLPVSDTMVLAPETEAVLFVIMAGKTPRDVVVRGKALLADVNANLTGVVLNNSRGVLPYYYNYKYYGY